jgi:hypothetical protein
MYGLVPYNISPIQQGIQFGHAVVEYSLQHGKNEDYLSWAKNDKTFIILNGGTTNNNEISLGTMNLALSMLFAAGTRLAYFEEPDLGDQLTAIVFLVDERVYDKVNYPDSSTFMGKDMDDTTKMYMDNFKQVHGDDWKYIADMQQLLANYRLA